MVFLITGCSIIDNFSDSVNRINNNVEISRNEMTLANILRASQQKPLVFSTVTAIHGSNGMSESLGLPTVTFGPAQTGAQHQWVFNNNYVRGTGTTSFDMTAINSKEFYLGILNPVDLRFINFFINVGFPRDLLFLLLVRSIVKTDKDGNKVLMENTPGKTSFEKFGDLARIAIDMGITTEIVHTKIIKGGPIMLKSGPSYADIMQAVNAGLELYEDAPGVYYLRKDQEEVRLCADSIIAVNHKEAKLITPQCGEDKYKTAGYHAIEFDGGAGGRFGIDVSFRSVYGIFQYLGLIFRVADSPVLYNGDKVLDIRTVGDLETCAVSATYDGSRYCVPNTDARASLKVFDLLSQLIALNTSIQDLPLTGSYRIVP